MAKKIIQVEGFEIRIEVGEGKEYISLTDIAKQRDDEPRFVIRNWMSTRNTILYLSTWEELHNENFNRAGFLTVRDKFFETGSLTPKQWLENTQSVGIESRSGRYGGTFAHSDIALNFCYWLSPAFQVYFIKEFQRLKQEEAKRLGNPYDIKRLMSKSTFSLLTSAIKENLLLGNENYTSKTEWMAYTGEVDMLNEVLFGQRAKEWKKSNPKKSGNMRDYASVEELILLNVLQGVHALLIKWDTDSVERKQILQEVVNDFRPIIKSGGLGAFKELVKRVEKQGKRKDLLKNVFKFLSEYSRFFCLSTFVCSGKLRFKLILIKRYFNEKKAQEYSYKLHVIYFIVFDMRYNRRTIYKKFLSRI